MRKAKAATFCKGEGLCHEQHVSIAWNESDGLCPLCAALNRVEELKKDRDRWITEYEDLTNRAMAAVKS